MSLSDAGAHLCPHHMAQSNVLPFEPPPATTRHPRAGFENIPRDLSKAELLRYFTYSPEDQREFFQCRGDSNKVGFALLLGGVRLTGRFPVGFELKRGESPKRPVP